MRRGGVKEGQDTKSRLKEATVYNRKESGGYGEGADAERHTQGGQMKEYEGE